MAAPVNATINVFANTDQAVAQFRSLQAQVASLNKTVGATSGAALAQQAALNKALMDGANASRMWNARVVPMNTAVSQFSDALDKGRMSLGQYTRYAASQLPGMSRVFRREFDMMNRVATQNVKQMQTQYMALGRSATGAAQAMAFTPTALDKQAAATQIAAQRQMMMNRMIDLGTTKLLNWGKNTQWAGRQLMVGFSIPLAMMGAAAAKAFKEIDAGTISFKRVYGDLQTTTAEMERNLDAVKELGTEYTKYGKSLASTIELSAKVAATGARNESLIAATEQTLRLATLGLMEYDEALEATVALQTAFQVSNEDLAGTIDFLNVVENETILTMQDMAAAIPRVAPVIKGLGGDVKDLAVFMTALREGGVTAEQGANALKSGLGRLINPTKAAREEAEKYGISIETIVQRNRGDLMGTVTEFGEALSALGQLEQQQVLQKVFGTYQYARLGALFRNLSNDAGQAQRTMELTSMSVEDLAKISERELSKIEEATSIKFQASIEKLKIAIAPIGETFMKALMPVIDFISKMLNAFNDLPDNVKNIIAITIGAIAGLGPIVLMTVGLIANGIANIGKLIQTMRKFFARLKGDASLFNYLTKEEREATAAANSLSGATDNLTTKFVGQRRALESLITMVGRYAGALASAAAAAPIGMGVGSAAMVAGARGATGRGTVVTGPQSRTIVTRGYQKGVVGVPGSGSGDKIPALLEPGESVVTKEATQKYSQTIAAMNAGTLPGFVRGVTSLGGIPVPAPVAQYNIKAGSVLPVEGLINDIKRIDGGLDALTAILKEFAQTGRLIGKQALKDALSARGISAPGSMPKVSGYSQLAGNVVDRSHVLGLGAEKTSGLLQNLNAALQSSNPVIKQHAESMLQNTRVVQLYTSDGKVLAREVQQTSQVFDALQRGTMALTSGFKGTVMGTPQRINNLYNEMPRNLRGDTLSLDTFKAQVKWAEQEFKELATKLNMTSAELADSAAIDNIVDQKQKERAKALRLLIVEGQEVAQLQMTEQEFLKNRLKHMGLALQAEKGQTNATIANAEAEKFATQQMTLLRNAGVFATDATIDYAKAMQMLAASAIGQAGGMIVAGQDVPRQVAKRAAQRRQASGYKSVANMGSIPTSVISPARQQYSALATSMGANRFTPIAQKEGITLGTAFGTGITTGASQSTKNLVPAVLKSSGHNSPAALMPKTGMQDGTAYGTAFSDSVKKAIMTGSGRIIPPGGGIPPAPPTGAGGGRNNFAAINEQAIKSAIMGPQTLAVAQSSAAAKASGALLRAELSTAMKEIGNVFRTLPVFAHESIRNIKPVFSRLGQLFLDLNPWITKSVDSVRRFLTQVSYSWMGIKLTGAEVLQNTLRKATMAYQEVMLQTAILWEKAKTLPLKAKSAYETAMIRTMLAWDSVKRIPAQMTNAVSTFMSDLPRNLQRLRTQIFYRGQDLAGRVSERLAPVRERLGRARDAVRNAGTIVANPVPRALAIATAGMVAQEKLNNAVTRTVQAFDPVRQRINQFGAAIAAGAQRISTVVQFMADPLARAVAIDLARQKIMQQFNRGIAAVSTALQPLRNTFNSFIQSTRNAAIRMSKFAQLMMDPLGRAVVLSTMANKVSTAFSNAAASVRAGANKLYESLLWGSIRAIQGVEKLTASIQGAFVSAKNGIVSGFNAATQAVRSGAARVYESFLWGSARTIMGIEKSWTAIRNATTAKWNQVVMAFNAANIKGAITDAWRGIKGAATQGATNIKTSLINAGTAIKNAGSIAAQMITAVGAGARGVGAGVSGWLGTVNEKTGRTRGQTIGTASNSAVMGLMGLSMAASFAGGEVGEMAQKIMPVTMGIMGLQMILPMLTNPLGLAIIATTALVGGFIYLRKQLDDTAKEAARLGANIGGVANGMKIIEEATGFKPPELEDRLFRFSDEDREAMAEFGSYFESEGGSKFIQELKESTSEERYIKVSRLLTQAVASGLDEQKAEAFGFAIAEATGDALLKSSIARDFANQIFGAGSQRLIELERQRLSEGPNVFDIQRPDYTNLGGGGLASLSSLPIGPTPQSPGDAAARGAVVGTAVAAGALTVAGVAAAASPGPQAVVTLPVAAGALAFAGLAALAGAAESYWRATERQREVTEEAAKGLGFALQTTQNLANAEAVLEQERRSQLIDFPEYEARLAEIRSLQDDMAEYIGQIFSVGADAGAMAQALGDQLSLAGFSEDQITRITDRFSPDALAKQFFGEEKDFASLGLNEQKYVQDVLTRVLSGLSPENAEQRLQDIEGTYSDMADAAVQAMVDGTMDALGGLDFFFNKENIADFINQRMGGGISGGTGYAPVSADQLATNVLESDRDLKALEGGGTDALEVFTRLAEFTDQNLAKSIMNSKNQILEFGEALIALKDYESIDLEKVMLEGVDVDQLVDGLNRVKEFKFDEETFGSKKVAKEIERTAISADQFGKILVDTGQAATMSGTDIEAAYGEAMQTYKTLLTDTEIGANELGNIEITPKLVPTLFGEDVENANGIYNSLAAAMPDGLPSIAAQILISTVANDPVTAALLANPAILEAVLAGKTTYRQGYYGGGQGGFRDVELPDLLKPIAGAFAAFGGPGGSALTPPPVKDPDDRGTSGSGGSKEKSALEELDESIKERTALYLGVTKQGEKLDRAKKGYLRRIAAQITTNTSIAGQLRRLNLSESLVADILGMGAEKAAEIIKQLGPEGLRRRNQEQILSLAGEFIEGKKSEVKRAEYRDIARGRLEAEGFTEEEIEQILEDEQATEIIALLPKKFQKAWKELIAWLRKAADATADVVDEAQKAEDDFNAASDRFEKLNDLMMQGFDDAELAAADKVASDFFTKNTKLAEGLAKSTGHTIENGYELAEAMERQVSINERLIDQEQDKIDKKQEEIDDYERTNALIQQGIDNLRRNDEIRNRRSESLSRDLEQISEAEDKIRKSYEERINALDKVAQINDHLIQQQQKQLNLSRAISEGDIYAATQAAQEMRAASAQQAAEQTRLGLERGMEAEIEGLTNAEGMTRAQIEEEIANIKEQNYQNSLLIRIEEDKIYQNSLEIRRLSNEIYNIQEDIIEPLVNQNKEYTRMLDYYKEDEAYQISRVTLAGMTRAQFERQADALRTSINNARELDPELKGLAGRYADIAREAGLAAQAAQYFGSNISASGYTGPWQAPAAVLPQTSYGVDLSGLTPDMFAGMDFTNLDLSGLTFGGNFGGFNSGGMVFGEGSRDSISAMLTPGEYVIRKAMVNKYGTPLMQALNQGSFTMPKYETGPEMPEITSTSTNVSSINAPVYNIYDMKFAISGTNQSADEIANKVMFKMKHLQTQNIRGNRGY